MAKLGRDLEAGHVRYRDVQHDDVGPQGFGCSERRRAIFCSPDHHAGRRKDFARTSEDSVVVVDEKNARRFRCRWAA